MSAPPIVGVNARDLSTFELDRDLFGTLADRIPSGVIRVAESAVKEPADVAHYRAAGADVVLDRRGARDGRRPGRRRSRASWRARMTRRAVTSLRDEPGPVLRRVRRPVHARVAHRGDRRARRRLRGREASIPRSRPSSPSCTAATPGGPRSSPRCRASPSTPAARRIILKREDLNHTGSHKINNVLGQALLTRRIGKTRVIAETGAGQHGVATATAAALFGLECTIYMGEVDTQRQALNVARMRLLGAEVVSVTTGSRTLKDAINEALPRLGHDRRDHQLHLRHRGRPASVPGHGARLPEDHRRGGARPGARAHRPAPGCRRRLRGRRLERDRHLPRLPRRPRGRSSTGSRRPATASTPSATPRRSNAAAPACCTARAATCCRTRTARPSSRTRSRPASTTRASGPSTPTSPTSGRASYLPGHRRRGDGGPAAAEPHRGHHPGDRVGARPRRGAAARPRARPGRDHPREPQRPRRQGRGDRGRAGSGSSTRARCSRERGRRRSRPIDRGAGADGAGARRLPAGRVPRPARPASTPRSRSSRTASTRSSSGCRTPTRSWTAWPSRRPPRRRSRAASGCATSSQPSRRCAPGRRARARDDLLEPGAAVRRRPFRRRAARRRGSGPHHARHHARLGRRLDRDERAHRARPGVPRGAVVHRRPPRGRPSRRAAASSTPCRRWASPAPAPTWTPRPARSSPDFGRPGDGPERSRASASASRRADQVAEVLDYADGAIVGSALVTALADGGVAGVAAQAASTRAASSQVK